jgi:Amt family ammonium transporter
MIILMGRSCDVVDMWAAFVIGVIGGFVYIGANKLLYRLGVDDPVDAVPIHGVK